MKTSYMFDDQLWKLKYVIHVNWHVPDSRYVIKVKRHVVGLGSFIHVNIRTKWKTHVLELPKFNLISETFEKSNMTNKLKSISIDWSFIIFTHLKLKV